MFLEIVSLAITERPPPKKKSKKIYVKKWQIQYILQSDYMYSCKVIQTSKIECFRNCSKVVLAELTMENIVSPTCGGRGGLV